jgi:vitamin B12 transporter
MIRFTFKSRLFCFKSWSRKRYSVLLSLHKVIKIGVLCLAYSLVNRMPVLHAQQDTLPSVMNTRELDEVEIIGRRSQIVSSEISRFVTVIRREEIEKAGIQSVVDLLEYVSNLDVRQRGIAGVQADVGIRGSSFDHVAVLLNGVSMGDPQTGHFNLDMPVDHESVERIEILEGPAARTLGPGAFLGAINIVTRKGEKNELAFSQSFGQHAFLRSHLHAAIKSGSLMNFLSLSRSASDGYMHNTDFEMYNAYYHGNIQQESTLIDIQGGYQHKSFGAGGFYSPRYPEQFETNDTWLASIKISSGNRLKISPQVYWRRKKDHFQLVRDNQDAPENFHLNDVIGSQLNLTYKSGISTYTIGFDLRSENIYSNNIGFPNPVPIPVSGTDSAYYTRQYQRTNLAFFMEYIINLRRFNITAGAMFNRNSGFHHTPYFFPGLDVSFKLTRDLRLYTSVNRALHYPTFTDLFYTDPVNQGNIDLKPNRMVSGEGGMKYSGQNVQMNIAGFYNAGKDIVDWMWNYAANRFSALNLKNYQVAGLSASFQLNFSDKPFWDHWLNRLSFHYTWMNIHKSIPDSVSKYYNLRHKISMSVSHMIREQISFMWYVSYQDRYGEAIAYDHIEEVFLTRNYTPYWLVDGSIKWDFRSFRLFGEVSNIFNTRYIDAGSALQPGRWFKVGMAVKLDFQ